MNHTHRLTQTIGSAIALSLFTAPGAALAAGETPGGGIASLVPLLLIMVIFYFLLIRPQQKRLKAHRALVSELKKGDKVVTSGGIYGTIHDVSEETVRIEIADGVRVRVKRDTISGLASE
ncbi:MAG TPA: preprotein translocase subunit YajC [Mariprofundaceae bacterium]|nr:preprotein translocase subunit YajC [Mariprofundaceae bacterium]